ncbi:MAG: hypothetical protein Q8O00_05000 [Holophaga sp.]|nr:hypothetical protein [Holophaga sp.]
MTTSIHFRRRWFYVLWGAMLLSCITVLILWETPKRSGTAKLTLRLEISKIPTQTVVKVWTGPRDRWPGVAWTGQDAVAEIRPNDHKVSLESLPLPVAYRRWGKDTIPRHTTDLVVLRFEAPNQSPRYMPFPLGQDWRVGLLRPGRTMSLSMDCGWVGLETDPAKFGDLE